MPRRARCQGRLEPIASRYSWCDIRHAVSSDCPKEESNPAWTRWQSPCANDGAHFIVVRYGHSAACGLKKNYCARD